MKKRTPKRRNGNGRGAAISRKTSETDISAKLLIDGAGDYHVDTGIPFFDHLLGAVFRHGFFDVQLKARGDLEVDFHHTVEDVGIVLGQAFRKALEGYQGIRSRSFRACRRESGTAVPASFLTMILKVPASPGRISRTWARLTR